MSYSEDLIKVRKRIADAVAQGVLEPKLKDFYEATLIQIMNESERQRQHCTAQAEQLRKQAATLDGQASGFAAQSSIVYNVLNMFILQAEKAAAEEAEINKQKLEDKIANQQSSKNS